MKPLDPSVHDAQIERNLPKIREKLEKQIDGLNKDIEHTNHARVQMIQEKIKVSLDLPSGESRQPPQISEIQSQSITGLSQSPTFISSSIREQLERQLSEVKKAQIPTRKLIPVSSFSPSTNTQQDQLQKFVIELPLQHEKTAVDNLTSPLGISFTRLHNNPSFI